MARRNRNDLRATGTPELAQLFREHRERHGISTREMARRIGSSRSFISNIEAGVRAVTNEETVTVVAEEVGVDPYEIYSRSNYPPHDLVRMISTLSAEGMHQTRNFVEDLRA